MNSALAEDIITAPPSAAEINSVYLFAINGCSTQPIRLKDFQIKCLKWQKQDETKTPAFSCLHWPACPFLLNIEPLPPLHIHVIANGKRCDKCAFTSSSQQTYLDSGGTLLTFGKYFSCLYLYIRQYIRTHIHIPILLTHSYSSV